MEYVRFFEAPDRRKDLNIEQPGPVNTNFPVDIDQIKLVIVCESPSYEEVSERVPAVRDTGSKIYGNLVRAKMLTDKLPYRFKSHYQYFQESGIYLTNLVRYQADYGTDDDDKDTKNEIVRLLWGKTKIDLFDELEAITQKYKETPVLLACGYKFKSQMKEVIEKLEQLNLRWFVTSHPSRCDYRYANNYNPSRWGESEIEMTALMKDLCKA